MNFLRLCRQDSYLKIKDKIFQLNCWNALTRTYKFFRGVGEGRPWQTLRLCDETNESAHCSGMKTLKLTVNDNYLVLEKNYFLSCNMTLTAFFLYHFYTFLLNTNEKLRLFQAINGYFQSHMSDFMHSYST